MYPPRTSHRLEAPGEQAARSSAATYGLHDTKIPEPPQARPQISRNGFLGPSSPGITHGRIQHRESLFRGHSVELHIGRNEHHFRPKRLGGGYLERVHGR